MLLFSYCSSPSLLQEDIKKQVMIIMMMMIASEMICEMYESAMFIYNYIANYYNKKKRYKISCSNFETKK